MCTHEKQFPHWTYFKDTKYTHITKSCISYPVISVFIMLNTIFREATHDAASSHVNYKLKNKNALQKQMQQLLELVRSIVPISLLILFESICSIASSSIRLNIISCSAICKCTQENSNQLVLQHNNSIPLSTKRHSCSFPLAFAHFFFSCIRVKLSIEI